jgi:hypothetical protein
LKISDTLRKQTLLRIGEKKNIRFLPADLERFKRTAFIGMPLLAYQKEIIAGNQPGLSINKHNNELATWIDAAGIFSHNRFLSIALRRHAPSDRGLRFLRTA